LYGLKENVILGRRIPVGTGFLPDEDGNGFTDAEVLLEEPEESVA
jgi:hypothetical protein